MAVGLAVVLVSCPRERPAAVPEPARSSPVPEPTDEPSSGPVVSSPDPAGGRASALTPVAGPVHPVTLGRLAIIIDDAGYDLGALQPFLELPMPLAISVLPNLPHSVEAARRVRDAGKELLLHLPMEPEGGEDPGPGALRTTDAADELERLLDSALATVPGAVGVNNHMGSKATADRAFMAVLLAALGRRNLFFVDSRTTNLTVAAEEAGKLGVPYLARKVFLDAVDGGIEESLASAVDAAARGGFAVAIGHVQTDGLAGILRRAEDGMERSGVRAAALAVLIAGRGGMAGE
jgi:uncharacterized protein